MNWFASRFAGVRIRGLLLTALIVVPLFAVSIYSYASERSDARADAHQRALNTAVLAAHEYARRVDTARQLLTPTEARDVTPGGADPARCNRTLAELMRQNPGYSNLFELNVNGDVICTAVPIAAPVNAADRDYFQDAMRTRAPAVGAPVIGRVSNRPSVVVGYPILNDRQRPIGVAGASLDLDSIVKLPDAFQIPPGTTVTIVDRQGIVLARNIDPGRWVGAPGPRLAALPDVFAGGSGTAVGAGTDGVERLYGMVPLRPIPNAPVQAALYVGIPTSEAYGAADADFRRQMLWLIGTGGVAGLIAWFGSERLVIAPLRRIANTTQRIARGEFDSRTGLGASGGEIGMLAAAVDRMATDLATTHAELENDRHEMASVLSSSPSVVALVEADGRVIRVNDPIERVFGYRAAEFAGRNIHELFDELVLPGGGGDPALHPFESIGHRRDQSLLPIEVVIRPVEGTQPQRFVVVLRDVTERKRAEADRELAQVAEARLDFLRTLNHELRSPITSVLGFGQLLDAEITDPRQRRQVQDIIGAGQHMLTLVNDLLDLSRIDAGRWEVSPEEFDAGQLIRDAVEAFEPLAAAQGLRLTCDVPPGPLLITSDARSLREILTNLLENAIKFTARGGVAVRAEPLNGVLEIQVADTGIGIASEHTESIFEPFVQLRTAAEGEPSTGSGLGLAITRRLVLMLDGEITVASTPGAGAVFTVRLPLPDSGRAGQRIARSAGGRAQ